MPCMSLFTCHETLKYCVVVELLDITSSSNLEKKGRSHLLVFQFDTECISTPVRGTLWHKSLSKITLDPAKPQLVNENANLYFVTFFWGGGGHDQTISLPKR